MRKDVQSSRKPIKSGFGGTAVFEIIDDKLMEARRNIRSCISISTRKELDNELREIDELIGDAMTHAEMMKNGDYDASMFSSRKPDVNSSIQGQERAIQAIMDEYGCTREEAIDIMNGEVNSGCHSKAKKKAKKEIKSSNENEILERGYKGHQVQHDEGAWILDQEKRFWSMSDLMQYVDEHHDDDEEEIESSCGSKSKKTKKKRPVKSAHNGEDICGMCDEESDILVEDLKEELGREGYAMDVVEEFFDDKELDDYDSLCRNCEGQLRKEFEKYHLNKSAMYSSFQRNQNNLDNIFKN